MVSIRRNVIVAGAAVALILASACSPRAADETSKPADAGGAKAAAAGEVPAEKAPLPPTSSGREEPEITLAVGKPAPPFVVGSWVKGEPIESLKPGQVYVVEFWATWCGPCLTGMPHISKLQTDYGDKVRIVGISREEESVVREFLTKEREEGVTWDQTITYSLAMDADNTMNTTWFRAAGRTGIPSAFLVGRDSVIEWIGHPARIDEPLAKVVDGSWDRAAAIAAYEAELKQIKAAAEMRKAQVALSKAVQEKDWTQALTLVDELIEKNPETPMLQLTKLSILSESGQSEQAQTLMDAIVKSDWDKGALLPSLAGGIASARLPGTLDDAERFARRAVELTEEKQPGQMHALARVYAEKGQLDEAIKWEKKVLELVGKNALVERTLRQYEERKEKESAGEETVPKPSAP